MVSPQNEVEVIAELLRLKLAYVHVEPGEVLLTEKPSIKNLEALRVAFAKKGFEICNNKKRELVENIKTEIVKMIHYANDLPEINYSYYLSQQLHFNYTYMANVFSAYEKVTIEYFIIAHKIDKVKELLLEGSLSLTDISFKMRYSSVAHLSNQFKKVTGMTPTYFRNKSIRRHKSE